MRIEAQVLKKKKFKTQGRKVYLTLKKKGVKILTTIAQVPFSAYWLNNLFLPVCVDFVFEQMLIC
jgi:predicted nucleic acid-binding Zn finger protein